MTNDLRHQAKHRAAASTAGKLRWVVPQIETVEGRVAGSSFSTYTGSDGFYYS
jgi:inosine/xanthosine triphosphate pyrophosphatase family protein